MSSVANILFINKEIQEVGFITIGRIMEVTSKSERTVRRYLTELKEFGAPLEYDKKRGVYFYKENFDKLDFYDEKFLLIYAYVKSLLKDNRIFPNFNFFNDNDVPKKYSNILSKFVIKTSNISIINFKYLKKILIALKCGNVLSVVYKNSKAEISNRDVLPLKLVFYDNNWYLIFWDILKKDFRNFKLSRIIELNSGTNSLSKKFNDKEIEQYINGSFGIFVAKDKNREVVIRFYNQAINIVKDQIWHENQETKLYDNYFELRLQASFPQELVGRVLSFGADAEVIAPDDYRGIWLKEIEKMYKKFIKSF